MHLILFSELNGTHNTSFCILKSFASFLAKPLGWYTRLFLVV